MCSMWDCISSFFTTESSQWHQLASVWWPQSKEVILRRMQHTLLWVRHTDTHRFLLEWHFSHIFLFFLSLFVSLLVQPSTKIPISHVTPLENWTPQACNRPKFKTVEFNLRGQIATLKSLRSTQTEVLLTSGVKATTGCKITTKPELNVRLDIHGA